MLIGRGFWVGSRLPIERLLNRGRFVRSLTLLGLPDLSCKTDHVLIFRSSPLAEARRLTVPNDWQASLRSFIQADGLPPAAMGKHADSKRVPYKESSDGLAACMHCIACRCRVVTLCLSVLPMPSRATRGSKRSRRWASSKQKTSPTNRVRCIK